MNKKFFIYIFLLVPILCSSCDWFNDSDRKEKINVKKIEVLPDSVRQYLIKQDSLKHELIFKIDTLTMELNASKKEMEQLRLEIKEIKSPGRVLVVLAIGSMLLSIIALLLSVIRTNKKVDKWEIENMEKQLDKHIKDLDFRMTRAECGISGVGKNSAPTNGLVEKRISDLDVRLSRIERLNNTLLSNTHSSNTHSSNTHSSNTHSSNPTSYDNSLSRAQDTPVVKAPEFVRTGYAKVNSSKYFVGIFDSQQEDCVYKINFINKEEGEFDIISLGKIQTINDLKEVLELAPGSCLLNEASTHVVEEKGRCKKIDDNTWEVTKKLVIKVFK